MTRIGLEDIGNELESAIQSSAKLPPVESWNPPLSGDIDIVIARDGTWHHEGSPIKRKPLVKLFASILKREGDEYFLVTPVEKWRLQVEDLPFVVVSVRCSENKSEEGAGNKEGQVLTFDTNVGDRVIAGSDHPLHVDVNLKTGEPRPHLRIRRNLNGRISRSVYYQLVDLAEPMSDDGRDGKAYGVSSCGVMFELK